MARNIHSNYFEDKYMRHECQYCRKSFIVGKRLSENTKLSCPYCKSANIETIAETNNGDDAELGCVGLYFHTYSDGSLMLYTENEFSLALRNYFNNTGLSEIPLGEHNKILKDYCEKRNLII